MPAALPAFPRRTVALLLAAAAVVVALASLSPGSALAYKANCVKHAGGTTVCNTKKPLTCRSGTPTICQDWRNRCTTRRSGAYSCDYVEKYARCRGANGRRCRTVYTSCTTTRTSSACHATAKAYCTIATGRHSCAFSSNACTSHGSSFRCTYSGTVHDCRDAWCKRARQTCHSGSGFKTWCINTVTMSAGLKPKKTTGTSGSGSSGSGSDTGSAGTGDEPDSGVGPATGDSPGSGDSSTSGDDAGGAVGELFQLDQLRHDTSRAQSAIRR